MASLLGETCHISHSKEPGLLQESANKVVIPVVAANGYIASFASPALSRQTLTFQHLNIRSNLASQVVEQYLNSLAECLDTMAFAEWEEED